MPRTAAPRRVEMSRRTLLGAAAAALGTGLVGRGAASSVDAGYLLEQGDRCLGLEPLSGDQPVDEFYDWGLDEQDYSSAGTVDLQRPATSILFLYEGPNGVSLVMVHGQLGGDAPGGSVTFRFDGLPDDSTWIVQDDFYDGPTNYDRWTRDGSTARVDWTWASGRTDGGAFRGFDDPDLDVGIVPTFNEGAALYGQYYSGEITRWQALSGSLDDPERHDLALDEPITLTRGVCAEVDSPVSTTPENERSDDEPDDDSDDGDDRPGEREGHEKHRGEGHDIGEGVGHDGNDHPGRGPQERKEAKKKRKKKRKKRNTKEEKGTKRAEHARVEVEVGDEHGGDDGGWLGSLLDGDEDD